MKFDIRMGRFAIARRAGVFAATVSLIMAAVVVGIPTQAVGAGMQTPSLAPYFSQQRPDRDGDGPDDGQEVYDGTDPLSPTDTTIVCPDGATPRGNYCPTPQPQIQCPFGQTAPYGQCPTTAEPKP